ncbi:transposase [Streptomyces sp. NPDC058409]|uniref:IS701 family transposase n=1 Tax=Streptomyces sp. NPDC058409 TaxID=3346484 RepID=UPI003661A8EB
MLIIGDTGFVTKGTTSAGVQRQYSGTAGRTENCQIGVFAAYATGRGHTLVDSELYLPKSWAEDRKRCRAARVPDDRVFATKGEPARAIILWALASPLPIDWVTADSAYGQDSHFRHFLEDHQLSYVVAVTKSQQIHGPRIDHLIGQGPHQKPGSGCPQEAARRASVSTTGPQPACPPCSSSTVPNPPGNAGCWPAVALPSLTNSPVHPWTPPSNLQSGAQALNRSYVQPAQQFAGEYRHNVRSLGRIVRGRCPPHTGTSYPARPRRTPGPRSAPGTGLACGPSPPAPPRVAHPPTSAAQARLQQQLHRVRQPRATNTTPPAPRAPRPAVTRQPRAAQVAPPPATPRAAPRHHAEKAALQSAAGDLLSAPVAPRGTGSPPPGTARVRRPAGAVVNAALAQRGTPYVWGDGSTTGPTKGCYDCSGLMLYAFYQGAGITLPRTSQQMRHSGTRVPRSEIQPGDLIVINNYGNWGHVGLYAGNGTMIHAPRPGKTVETTPTADYWTQYDWDVRRVL